MNNPIENIQITWSCRFHPTDWFHEVGCPHREWTKEELQGALETAKKTIAYHFELFKKHQEMPCEHWVVVPTSHPKLEGGKR